MPSTVKWSLLEEQSAFSKGKKVSVSKLFEKLVAITSRTAFLLVGPVSATAISGKSASATDMSLLFVSPPTTM